MRKYTFVFKTCYFTNIRVYLLRKVCDMYICETYCLLGSRWRRGSTRCRLAQRTSLPGYHGARPESRIHICGYIYIYIYIYIYKYTSPPSPRSRLRLIATFALRSLSQRYSFTCSRITLCENLWNCTFFDSTFDFDLPLALLPSRHHPHVTILLNVYKDTHQHHLDPMDLRYVSLHPAHHLR